MSDFKGMFFPSVFCADVPAPSLQGLLSSPSVSLWLVPLLMKRSEDCSSSLQLASSHTLPATTTTTATIGTTSYRHVGEV